MAAIISTVFKNLSSRPRTRMYPFEERQLPMGSRGHIEFDMSKCVFCTLCAKRCPADAIHVDRKGKTLEFNPFRCIVCEFCLEGCAKDAISLFQLWRAPVTEMHISSYGVQLEE
ncbi:MAG: 4Fe-4S binding protein [Syntrophomonas sp.]